jgi:hypothetical protein
MRSALQSLASYYLNLRRDDGAVGWLVLGVLLGAILVVIMIVQLLIPGDGD